MKVKNLKIALFILLAAMVGTQYGLSCYIVASGAGSCLSDCQASNCHTAFWTPTPINYLSGEIDTASTAAAGQPNTSQNSSGCLCKFSYIDGAQQLRTSYCNVFQAPTNLPSGGACP